MTQQHSIKAIVGLGNPGPRFQYTPHNIGFLIVDELAQRYNGTWSKHHNFEQASVTINNHSILLIKPQTFMNSSGEITPFLRKKGIKIEDLLVVHDEIDFPFGKISLKMHGSARGHNGLRSFIQIAGDNFMRLRVGVSRPDNPADVGDFVISKFKESQDQVDKLIQDSITIILEILE